MSKRREYSKEFKLDALRLHEKSEKSMAQIERDLGVTEGLLSKWKRRYRVEEKRGGQEPTLKRSEIEDLRAENRRLKRELETVKQEREILKTYNRVHGTS